MTGAFSALMRDDSSPVARSAQPPPLPKQPSKTPSKPSKNAPKEPPASSKKSSARIPGLLGRRTGIDVRAPRKSTGPDDISKYFYSDDEDDDEEQQHEQQKHDESDQENMLDNNVDFDKFVCFEETSLEKRKSVSFKPATLSAQERGSFSADMSLVTVNDSQVAPESDIQPEEEHEEHVQVDNDDDDQVDTEPPMQDDFDEPLMDDENNDENAGNDEAVSSGQLRLDDEDEIVANDAFQEDDDDQVDDHVAPSDMDDMVATKPLLKETKSKKKNKDNDMPVSKPAKRTKTSKTRLLPSPETEYENNQNLVTVCNLWQVKVDQSAGTRVVQTDEGVVRRCSRQRRRPMEFWRATGTSDVEDGGNASEQDSKPSKKDAPKRPPLERAPLVSVIDAETQKPYNVRLIQLNHEVRPASVANGDFKIARGIDDGICVTGTIYLPPRASKPKQMCKTLSMVGYVIAGTVRVTIHETKVEVGQGGTFIVPEGNTYKLVNHGAREAKIFITSVRSGQDDEKKE